MHIVFNESELALMKEVMMLDATLAGEVILIRDDYAVGPLAGIDTEEGWTIRQEWWQDLLRHSHYKENEITPVDDRETMKLITEKLDQDPEEQLWIWMGQNQHDVCGYFWMIPQLSTYQGRVMVLYMNNLPFINDKGQLFYPSWLQEIPAREFVKAKKLARPVTLSEFEVDPDEWRRLAEENGSVRVLEGGKKILSKDETFYDTEILKNLNADWQKGWRVVSNTLHRMKIKTGDVFIEWRIKMLVDLGKIDLAGEAARGWKDIDLKLGGIPSATAKSENENDN